MPQNHEQGQTVCTGTYQSPVPWQQSSKPDVETSVLGYVHMRWPEWFSERFRWQTEPSVQLSLGGVWCTGQLRGSETGGTSLTKSIYRLISVGFSIVNSFFPLFGQIRTTWPRKKHEQTVQ